MNSENKNGLSPPKRNKSRAELGEETQLVTINSIKNGEIIPHKGWKIANGNISTNDHNQKRKKDPPRQRQTFHNLDQCFVKLIESNMKTPQGEFSIFKYGKSKEMLPNTKLVT